MKIQKLLNVVLLLAFLTSFVGGGSFKATAQTPEPPTTDGTDVSQIRLTQADREAAADRAAADGLTLDTIGAANMPMPGSAPRYFSHPNYANSPLPGNSVAEWNAFSQEILQPTPMPGMPMTMTGASMSTAFVYLAYIQGAVYNALVAIEGGYAPYQSTLPAASPDASRDAAVAAASYQMLLNFLTRFPNVDTQVMLDNKYNTALADIVDTPANIAAGVAVGNAAAAEMITLRTNDGLLVDIGYIVPTPGAGVWEPTVLPDGTVVPPVDPWMSQLVPFLRSTADQYRAAPPPALTDAAYLTDLAEVRDWGGAVSANRTAEQTEVARFWTTNMVIQTNASYRQIAESRNLGLLDTARLMAMGNMVATDSLIYTFDTKYNYNFWRPTTAIRHTNPDGSYSATELNTWMPAVMVPSFPEYVAGHGSFVSSQAEVYTQFFGTDVIAVDLSSSITGTTRHYATAADMRTEVVNARTWGGLHFRSSSELAVTQGQILVTDALATYFVPAADRAAHVTVTGGIRKFVDELPVFCDPALGPCTGNGTTTLDQYLPVAVPDTTTYPGADYYEIAVVQYEEQLHSDLPPTLLRGYVQLATADFVGENVPLSNVLLDGTLVATGYNGVTPPHYLGPTIIATKDRPVRILFRNLLPTGVDGDLFLPVDTTVMGAGMGPLMDPAMDTDGQNPMCGMLPKPYECYTDNRATLHLHGGITPWISDGTPHQWITPADETTPYPEGVSVVNVPDMVDPGPGAMNFYYTNQQSARLMFYHDHSWGITRLNVYAGGAAPYLITDATEQTLLNQGLIPAAANTIPLIVQDKTFVPSQAQLAVEDETWDLTRYGNMGDLWLPHVYSPAQNAGDSSGVNQFGRWAYGPWFWPPTIGVEYGPIPNPYYDAACNPDIQWCEPPLMPGTPYNSMGMEAFMDTPLINGTAYPTLNVDPEAYRFRILNAANDRFFNLSLYVAMDAAGNPCDPTNVAPVAESTGMTCTEVRLNDVLAALEDPTIFPTPDQTTAGPSWVQIATEGGFLPAPAVIPAQPITWVNDPTVFNAGNIDLHSLLIGPAERADAIVDFSAFAGYTLILYNDAPAAFPARDPRYDYYTGNGDYRDTGGAPSTLPGYGPNTRTIMQIRVSNAAATPFNLVALENAFKATSLGGLGVFENGQHPIIVGQGVYNSAYGTSFQTNGPLDGLAQIFETSMTFATLSGVNVTMPFQPKMIQDEMGEAFDPIYGRMSGNLGVESPNPQAGNQNMILYGFTSPPTEVLNGVELPPGVSFEQIDTQYAATDGTQIWKITHNGVDTHPIHFHLYDVQLLNRVGWDGIVRPPDANERGWKDTVRVSPLEDTIVALRPLTPQLPWVLPNSVRLMDPSMPEGAVLASSTLAEASGLVPMAFDPTGEPIDIFNHYVNYGAEYVWHCHILSHEEMDMMRPVAVGFAPSTPTGLTAFLAGGTTGNEVLLTWTDTAVNDTGYTIQRATDPLGIWVTVGVVSLDITAAPATGVTMTYTDILDNSGTVYYYRVLANNVVGDTWDYSDPVLNNGASFPTISVDSGFSNTASVQSTIITIIPLLFKMP